MELLKNKYVQILFALIIGVIVGYACMRSKVITKESEAVAYEKTISELTTKLATATHIRSKTTIKNGVTTIVSDTQIKQNSVTTNTTSTASKTKTKAYEKIEINQAYTRIMAGVGTGKHGFQMVDFRLQRDIFGRLGVYAGCDYDVKNKDLLGKIGISLGL